MTRSRDGGQVVPSSPSIAYPWVGRIIVAGLPCLLAPRSTCLPFSYVNCIVTQKYYKCAIMSRKNLCQTSSTPTLRHKARFPYEYLLRLEPGSRTGLVGGLTGRLR